MLVSDLVPTRRVNVLKVLCFLALVFYSAVVIYLCTHNNEEIASWIAAIYSIVYFVGLFGCFKLSKWMISVFMFGKVFILAVDLLFFMDSIFVVGWQEFFLYVAVMLFQVFVIYLAVSVRRDIVIAEYEIESFELPTTVQEEDKIEESLPEVPAKNIPTYYYPAQAFPTTPFMYYPQMMNPAYGYPAYVMTEQQQEEVLNISPSLPLLSQ